MARAALSLPFSGLSGSLGDTVIVQLPDGPQVRRRTLVRKGRTPAQDAARRRMEAASRAWAGLDEAVFQAWRRYALLQAWRNPATGAIVTPKAYCLFCGLASKALQVEADLDLAAFGPPTRAFTGDGVLVSVAPSFHSGRRKGPGNGESEAHETCSLPPTPSSPGTSPPREEGASLIFSASAANAPGVVTELLAQPLVNARRAAYRDKYASKGFVAFDGAEAVEVPVPAGAYACAFRFVRTETGQETALVELGVVEVG